MSTDTSEIRAALRGMLADVCGQDAVVAAEPLGWNEQVWQTLDEAGFTLIGVAEDAGGSGGTLTDGAVVLQELGRASASVPYAEHALIAGWLLTESGRDLGEGVRTAAVLTGRDELSIDNGAVSGTVARVPWARAADRIVLVAPSGDGAQVAVVDRSSVEIRPGRNLADEARDTIRLDRAAGETWTIDAGALREARLRLAFARAALISGALERVQEISVRYTGEREQFGRPVARFQAVQRHLVKIAEQTHLARMAVDAAAYGDRTTLDEFAVSAAKIIASESASAATAHAHQAHGAIGMTKEYELGQLSRRLWSWRDEGGSETAWGESLGEAIAEAGADALWPRISDGVHEAATS
ncbi:acyl-CoA dehydrogenase family protein [Cumulibacter manganitolerans]|uniref:acyl-CoA dehydrogenase family protein n=1 Tax=Cumulibacter manganitolerans TaxID=1884992 RepID=UPI00129640CA|nr:acyl-CoA dehydrogenase family protein [Cumulibacter manganitolerans]